MLSDSRKNLRNLKETFDRITAKNKSEEDFQRTIDEKIKNSEAQIEALDERMKKLTEELKNAF